MAFWNFKQSESQASVETDSKIEVVAHKQATRDQVAEVRKANDMLNEVLAKNGFTIKIFLAAGGHKPPTRKR